MKFILNGGLIFEIEDGTNFEIYEFTGDENILISGESSDDGNACISYYANNNFLLSLSDIHYIRCYCWSYKMIIENIIGGKS